MVVYLQKTFRDSQRLALYLLFLQIFLDIMVLISPVTRLTKKVVDVQTDVITSILQAAIFANRTFWVDGMEAISKSTGPDMHVDSLL